MDDADGQHRVRAGDAKASAPRRKRGATRLWLLPIAALLVPAAILGTGAWGAWYLTWTETRRDLMRGAEVNADFVRRNFESLARTAGRIAEATVAAERAPSEAALQDLVLDMVREQALLRAVVVLGADGRPLLRVDPPSRHAPVADPTGGEIAAALAQAPPGRIATGLAYRQGDATLLAIGLRVGPDARAVVFVLDAAEIGRAFGRHTDSAEDSAALIRSDGHILARMPTFTDPPPPLDASRPLMQALAAGRHSGALMGVTPRDDRPVAVAYARIAAIPDLVVAVGRRRSDILERWRDVMVPLLLVGLPAVIGLMGLALVVRRQQDALGDALDGLEQRVAERTVSLREEQERLRLAVEAAQLGTWETDLPAGVSTRSQRALEILGFQPDMPVGHVEDWAARIHPGDRRRVLDLWDSLVEGREALYRAEYRFLRGDGVWRWIESTGAVVRADAETGRPLRLAGTLRDVTERREAEERRELLTQEVNHRARNALAIVQAILRLTNAATPAEFARLVEGRIAALARAQSLLAAERWAGAPLATLIADELAPFGGVVETGATRDGRFVLDGPPFRIHAEAVQALGMVFHELATNAAKHGALSVPAGRVTVAWIVDEAEAVLHLRWTEAGGPPPGLPTRRGVGSRVIEATVTGQLGGSVERRWPDEGLICDIVLPLARTRAGPG